MRHLRWSFSSVKMLSIGGGLAMLTLALALNSSSAEAQLVNGRWQLPPRTAGRQGVVRPQPQVIFITPSPFHHQQHQQRFAAFPVAFTVIPAVLMSDGSVFADFGFGFEPVLRPCASAVVVASSFRVVASNGVVVSPGPATHIHPSPTNITPSQQNLPSMQARNIVLSSAAQSACFGRDQSGRVLAYR